MSLPPDDDRTVMSFNGATPAPTHAHNPGSNHALPNGTCVAEFAITGLVGEGVSALSTSPTIIRWSVTSR